MPYVRAKGWLSSKTILLLGVLPFTVGFLELLTEAAFIPAAWTPVILMVIGVLTAIMRFLTKLPLSSSPLKSQRAGVEGPGL